MNNELNNLLEIYQVEKNKLEECIKLSINDLEYKVAFYHSRALKKINQKIRTLQQLQNPNTDTINLLMQRKEWWEKDALKDEIPEGYASYLQRQIQEVDLKIKDLSERHNYHEIDGQEFDDIIFDLVDNKIQNFKLYLNQSNDLYLDFKKKDLTLLISLPKFKLLREKGMFFKNNKKALKTMGFKKNKIENSLIYAFDLSDFKDAINLKMLVSHIIYDGIGYYNVENSSIIKIIS